MRKAKTFKKYNRILSVFILITCLLLTGLLSGCGKKADNGPAEENREVLTSLDSKETESPAIESGEKGTTENETSISSGEGFAESTALTEEENKSEAESTKAAVKDTSKAPEKEGNKATTKETSKDAAKETTKAPAKETSKASVKETTKAQAKESSKAPAKETTKAPVKETTSPAKETSAKETTAQETTAKETTKAPETTSPQTSKAPETKANTCTISISCKTILSNMDKLKESKKEFVPSNGVILGQTTVEFSDGDTVYDVLKKICKSKKIQIEANYSPMYSAYYVEGIGHLYEFDCGPNSGWTYRVNGKYPNYGCSKFEVKPGDKIEWLYTCE